MFRRRCCIFLLATPFEDYFNLGPDSSIQERVDQRVEDRIAVDQPNGEDSKPVSLGDVDQVDVVPE